MVDTKCFEIAKVESRNSQASSSAKRFRNLLHSQASRCTGNPSMSSRQRKRFRTREGSGEVEVAREGEGSGGDAPGARGAILYSRSCAESKGEGEENGKRNERDRMPRFGSKLKKL